ncbi:hypothetical protein I1A49_05080 [Streptomyces malaysiensis subsp. malaysiensis]|uniref:Uncharacterized protein n=1 Tax=Streptomyces malaysiensis TaxID=92644 RepID=A0ABX6WNI3_STRMQ|nr:hypothetical protein I1A49_05080 [Streptomyces solisilvae]
MSLAWGFWAERSDMTGHLADADVARMERSGVLPLSSDEGLALLDAASAMDRPLLSPYGSLRQRSAVAPVPYRRCYDGWCVPPRGGR